MRRHGVMNGVRTGLVAILPRSESDTQRAVVHTRSGQIHSRVIDEIGLVDHHERLAVARLHGKGRLNAVDDAHGRRRVQHLRAIEPRPIGRNPPRFRVVREVELGELIGFIEIRERGLRGKLVAEADTIVECRTRIELAAWNGSLDD